MNNNFRKRILEDNNGTLWIAANFHGLSWYDPKTETSGIYTKNTGQLSTNILMGDMALDPQGRIWISTDGGGINILDPITRKFSYIFSNETDPESLSSDHIYTIYFDDQHIAWVGSFDKGI